MIYKGSCHCGAIQWRLKCLKITQAVICNCSICHRRGAVMSEEYFSPQAMEITSDLGRKTYRFGDLMVDHFFCGTCGVYVFHQVTAEPGRYRINLACLAGFDPGSVSTRFVNGRAY